MLVCMYIYIHIYIYIHTCRFLHTRICPHGYIVNELLSKIPSSVRAKEFRRRSVNLNLSRV